MQTKIEILRSAQPINKLISKLCFIYFLIDKGEIVYVGSTTKGLARIYAHLEGASLGYRQEKKIFDSYHYIICPNDDLYEHEATYILEFMPRYNHFVPTNSKYIHFTTARKTHALSAAELNHLITKHNITVYKDAYIKSAELDPYAKDFKRTRPQQKENRGRRPLDLLNKEFGYLTPIKFIGIGKQGGAMWKCKCVCGQIVERSSANLRQRQTQRLPQSCGCINRKRIR